MAQTKEIARLRNGLMRNETERSRGTAAAGAGVGCLAGGVVAYATGGGPLAYLALWMAGGAAGGYAGAPEDRRMRGAKGGAIGGIVGPIGSAVGAYVATAKPDEGRSRNAAHLRRSLTQ